MFGERMRILRKEKGLTQKEIAEAIDLSWRAIQDIEAGKNPGYATMMKIAEYFDVSMDYLMGRTEDRRLHR